MMYFEALCAWNHCNWRVTAAAATKAMVSHGATTGERATARRPAKPTDDRRRPHGETADDQGGNDRAALLANDDRLLIRASTESATAGRRFRKRVESPLRSH